MTTCLFIEETVLSQCLLYEPVKLEVTVPFLAETTVQLVDLYPRRGKLSLNEHMQPLNTPLPPPGPLLP